MSAGMSRRSATRHTSAALSARFDGPTWRRSSQGGEVTPAILDACRRGDRDAFRALYEAYKDRVYSIAFYFFHGDPEAASDVTQQVFLKLIRDIARFRGDAAFSTWLYRLVINACVDRSRRQRTDTADADPLVLDTMPAHAPSHEDVFVGGELASSVQAAIASLPAKLRTAILLRYFDDLSYSDMAAALHCSIGTVASRLSRGHRLLAKKLEPLRTALPQDGRVEG